MKLHESLTTDRIIEAARESTFGTELIGLCIYCGDETSPIEPDARKVHCESCGKPGVYGAEDLVIYCVG